MTRPLIPDQLIQETTFYLSGALPCPYLAGQMERKLFARMGEDKIAAVALNSLLTQTGFRRSHDVIYRPACPACSACVPVRIPVGGFVPDRTQRRLVRRCRDWTTQWEPPDADNTHYALFHRYQCARHAESDMVQMDAAAYRSMLLDGSASLQLLTLRDPVGALRGVLLADRLADGFSAIYSFYDPDAVGLSLGTLLVLRLIAEAAAAGLPHVYLGYWIAASRKMAYKANFRPQEHLTAAGWCAVA